MLELGGGRHDDPPPPRAARGVPVPPVCTLDDVDERGLTVQAVQKLREGFRHDDLLLGLREENPRCLFARFKM